MATFLAFPHPLGGRVIDLGLVMAWIAPAFLLLGLEGLGPGRAAAAGFVASEVAYGAIFHWIYVVTVVYGHASPVVGVIAPLALALYPALFGAAFGAAFGALAGRGLAGPFTVAALWAGLDYLRSIFLTGFPWALLGYAQHQNGPLLALTAWTGVYGLSYLSALGGAAAVAAVRAVQAPGRARRAALAPVLAAALVLGAAHALGAAVDATAPPEPRDTLRVAVLQGDIDQGVKWNPAWAERTLEAYEELTRQAAARGARVVVWPETAVPGSITTDPVLRERLAGLASSTHTLLVVGGVGISRAGRRLRFYDSAFAFAATGEQVARYDKSHLVPFGEYVPLRGLLGHFLGAVARGIAPDDVSPGPGPRALVLPTPGGGSVSAGVPICYELLFPDLVRRFVDDGAEVLFAITNDAWYGRTGAPYQFLAITALRSAENRVWTARAANTGVSAFIDDRGRVRARTKIFERSLLVYDVPLRPSPVGGSFYARHGDVFALGCWAWLAGVVGFAVARDWRLARLRSRGQSEDA